MDTKAAKIKLKKLKKISNLKDWDKYDFLFKIVCSRLT
jgi:hypothetical protein